MEGIAVELGNINEIVPALRSLKPGEQMVYHRGYLAYDRDESANKANIRFIANTAFELWSQGKVCLTQRRLSYFTLGNPAVFEYIVTGCSLPQMPRRSRPKKDLRKVYSCASI